MNAAYYLWAQRQIAAEIASDFASLKSLQASGCSRFLRVFQSLPGPAKLAMWNHLLKRFHAEGAKAVGTPMTDEDRLGIQRYDEARRSLMATEEPAILSGKAATASVFLNVAERML